MSTLRVLIDGQDYTTVSGVTTDLTSIRANDTLVANTNTCNLSIYRDVGASLPAIVAGKEVQWQVQDASGAWQNVFGGVLQRSTEKIVTSDTVEYQCECTGYEPWFNRHLVIKEYPSQAGDTTVKDIVTNFANKGYPAGFTANHVQTAPILPSQTFKYLQPGAVMSNLANLLSWLWYIDSDRDVHFFGLQGEPVPGLVDSNTLDITLGAGDTRFGGHEITTDMTQLKNKIYITGYGVPSANQITDNFTGDGKSTVFQLGQEPFHRHADISVTVDGTSYSIKTDVRDGRPGHDPTGSGTMAFINYSRRTVRFDPAPASGAAIAVTYNYLVETVYVRQNGEAIRAQAEHGGANGPDGIFEYHHANNGYLASSTDWIAMEAQQLLYRYGWEQKSGTFTVFSDTPIAYRAGQYFTLQSNGTRAGGLLDGQTMWIVKVNTSIAEADSNDVTLKYDVTWASTPYYS